MRQRPIRRRAHSGGDASNASWTFFTLRMGSAQSHRHYPRERFGGDRALVSDGLAAHRRGRRHQPRGGLEPSVAAGARTRRCGDGPSPSRGFVQAAVRVLAAAAWAGRDHCERQHASSPPSPLYRHHANQPPAGACSLVAIVQGDEAVRFTEKEYRRPWPQHAKEKFAEKIASPSAAQVCLCVWAEIQVRDRCFVSAPS